MLPTSFRPLLTRIREVVLNGLGTGSRTIPAGTFSVEAGEFRNEDDALARGVLSKPQAVARIESLSRNSGMNENSSFVMVDLSFVVDVAYHSNADLMASERAAIEVQVNNDVTRIRKALNNPTALERTSAGDETGLCSGLLDWEDSGPVIYDYKNALVKNAVTFTATALFDIGVVLGYPECASPPVIAGAVEDGNTLTSTTGVWLFYPSSYAYQWFLDGVAISGATASTYLVTAVTASGDITLRVTATNAAGSNSALSNSLASTATPPTVSISGAVSKSSVLTASETGDIDSRQWQRGNVFDGVGTYSACGGSDSGLTYTPVKADIGYSITCQVTGPAGTVRSNALIYSPPTADVKGDWRGDYVTLTAGRISEALDQSGTGVNATMTTPAIRPVQALAATPSGRAAMDFSLNAGGCTALATLGLGLGASVTTYTIGRVAGSNKYYHDGTLSSGLNTRVLEPYLGNIIMYAGEILAGPVAPVLGSWASFAAVFNGASSKLAVNDGTVATGNVGVGTSSDLTLGSSAGLGVGQCLNEQVARIVVYNAAHSDSVRTDLTSYLENWGGL